MPTCIYITGYLYVFVCVIVHILKLKIFFLSFLHIFTYNISPPFYILAVKNLNISDDCP